VVDATTVKSSTSSFTQVSGLNDDFLSPRSSSNSTITATPTTPQAHGRSPGSTARGGSENGADLTPSAVPLPPVTALEETELATPRSGDLRVGDATPTPQDTQDIDTFFQQSGEKKRELQVH